MLSNFLEIALLSQRARLQIGQPGFSFYQLYRACHLVTHKITAPTLLYKHPENHGVLSELGNNIFDSFKNVFLLRLEQFSID